MAGITLGHAIGEFIRELGCPPDRESILRRITEAIEWLLFNGGGDILHEWRVPVRRGRTTLPRSLETPVKYKFENCAIGGFGTFTTAYSSYSPIGVKACYGFDDWEPLFEVKANSVAVQHQPPANGVRVIMTCTNREDVGKKCSIAGSYRGYQIAPTHNGFDTAGEILTYYHQDDPEKRWSSFRFDHIDSVVRDRSHGYTMLSGIAPDGKSYFLSHYHPDEEVPLYREIELFACPTFASMDWNCDFLMYILGRVNPSMRYFRDEDVLPITSLTMLQLLAKRSKYLESNDFDTVSKLENQLQLIIRKAVIYKAAPGSSLIQSITASGANQRNI